MSYDEGGRHKLDGIEMKNERNTCRFNGIDRVRNGKMSCRVGERQKESVEWFERF